jgi:acetyltransferase-like isoleucine patch superfamily enzyme
MEEDAMIGDSIKKKIDWYLWRKKWRKQNIDNVSIGRKTYGMINAHIYNNQKERLIIGSFCSIAENVHFVFGEHDYRHFSTYPFNVFVFNECDSNSNKGDIVVEDDVWIGMNCTILSGVTIHRGAVIGAGTVVAKDVPPYAIYAGDKIIKYRFSDDIINKMMKIDYNFLTDDVLNKYRDEIYQEVDENFFESGLYNEIVPRE